MDKIYPPDKFPCSESISLNQYFSEMSKLYAYKRAPKSNSGSSQSEEILNIMNIEGEHRRKALVKSCSLKLLTVEGEEDTSTCEQQSTKVKKPVATTQGKQLNTVKIREEFRAKFRKIYEKYHQTKGSCPAISNPSRSGAVNIIPGTEFAVAVRVYHPYELVEPNQPKFNSFRNLKFSHEITILASNTLADLRDKIICQTDIGLSIETEDPTTEICVGNAKEIYPSGFIFIENVFYNDTRHPNCIDYSEPIRKWANEKNIGSFKTAILEKTCVKELALRFGYPYVYQHQAICEHIIVFSDAWLITQADNLNTEDYPYYNGIQALHAQLCSLCNTSNAKWICTESDRLPHVTTLMCQDCLMQYNYKDGKKIGNFKLYPYFEKCLIT